MAFGAAIPGADDAVIAWGDSILTEEGAEVDWSGAGVEVSDDGGGGAVPVGGQDLDLLRLEVILGGDDDHAFGIFWDLIDL